MSSHSTDRHTVLAGRRGFALVLLAGLLALLATASGGCGSSAPAITTAAGQTATTAAAPAGTAAAGPAATTALTAGYWPTDDWRQSTPEDQGISSQALVKLLARVDEQQLNMHSLLIVRNGYLVTEAYWNPYTADERADVASVTKSVTSALIGIAIDKGYIRDEQATVLGFFADKSVSNLDDRKKAVTIQDLLTMTSGLPYSDVSDPTLAVMRQSPDWISFMLDQPMAAAPGTSFTYSTGATHLLSGILTASTGQTLRAFANENLFGPIGIPAVAEDQWPADPQGLSLGGASLRLTPRDMARLGYLYLKDGVWAGRPVISPEWIAESTALHTMKDDGFGEGYLWSLDPKQGSFWAFGRGGQQIYVFPAEQLVVVMTANLQPGENRDFTPLKTLFDDYLVPAIQSDGPLPADPAGVEDLNRQVRHAADPLQPVPALSATARRISGQTFDLAQNDSGWQTIQFDFTDGGAQSSVLVNGAPVDPPIGLDNVYRVGRTEEGPTLCMRGSWTAEDTFVVTQLTLGSPSETTARIRFAGDNISMTATEFPSGNTMTIQGTMRPTG
jgi:CubicO group peptidase (beta-lactamase class C family)